jgi:hypothetical protein
MKLESNRLQEPIYTYKTYEPDRKEIRRRLKKWLKKELRKPIRRRRREYPI